MIIAWFRKKLVVMDFVMTGMCGTEATRWIKVQSNASKVILISPKRTKISVVIKSGIDGYIPKNIAEEKLFEAMQRVCDGMVIFTEAISCFRSKLRSCFDVNRFNSSFFRNNDIHIQWQFLW